MVKSHLQPTNPEKVRPTIFMVDTIQLPLCETLARARTSFSIYGMIRVCKAYTSHYSVCQASTRTTSSSSNNTPVASHRVVSLKDLMRVTGSHHLHHRRGVYYNDSF